jgi:diguanylate cyclase
MANTGKPPAPAATVLTPAQIAKLALRHLAEHRQEPTPENYRKAYDLESGAPPSPPAPQAAAETPVSQADEGEKWSTLITRVVRGAERGGRQWTTARKKDSLQRVLESSKSSGQRLHQRLSQLVSSWDSDTLDSSLLESDCADANGPTGSTPDLANDTLPPNAEPAKAAPSPQHDPNEPASPTATHHAWPALAHHAVGELGKTLGGALNGEQMGAQEAAQAVDQAWRQAASTGQTNPATPEAIASAGESLTQACEQARRVIDHRHHLIDQLGELCASLTDSLVDLSEDDSWVQGQCAALRHQLDEGLHHRGVRHMQQLLTDTRVRQRALKVEREAARLALKQLIHEMLRELADLGQTTDQFQTNLGHYADTIGQADTLESLTDVVRNMVEESRAVQSLVAQTQGRLQSEHARATELTDRVRQLEDEIRRLSDEVSTDPLTQIANRRGMQRAFEAEQARVARTGACLAVGLLDVDNFKKLNDQMGHQTGDEALKFLARRVSECLRPVDVVARYGGEEFVVFLPDTVAQEAQQVLTRLQRTLSAEFFTHEDKKVFITFSAGVTAYRGGEVVETALERADVALYEAKRTGKNRTCIG